MLITSHPWKLILKPSWTIIISSFNFLSSEEGGGQECHWRAGGSPRLISTFPFPFKILDAKNAIYSFYRALLPCPTSAANHHLSCLSHSIKSATYDSTSRLVEAAALEWCGRSEADWWHPAGMDRWRYLNTACFLKDRGKWSTGWWQEGNKERGEGTPVNKWFVVNLKGYSRYTNEQEMMIRDHGIP